MTTIGAHIADNLDILDVVVERTELDRTALDQRTALADPVPPDACSLVEMSSWTCSRPCGAFTENRPWGSGWAWRLQDEPSMRPKTKLLQPPLG